MKIIKSLFLAISISCTLITPSLSESYKDPLVMVKGYGFVLGQNSSLEMIQKQHPSLARDAKIAKYEFDASPFGNGSDVIEKKLKESFKDNWSKLDAALTKQIKELTPGHLSLNEAKAFIELVRKRSKGDIDPNIRTILLQNSKRYLRNPALEILDGMKTPYSIKGHPKSKGANITVSYPMSWTQKEGVRPNIIQTFSRTYEGSYVHSSLMVAGVPSEIKHRKLTQKEKEALFDEDNLDEYIQEGFTFIKGSNIVLEGEPGIMLISKGRKKRLDVTMDFKCVTFMVLNEKHFIIIHFMVAMQEGDSSLKLSFDKMLLLFKTITNTYVANNKYKKL